MVGELKMELNIGNQQIVGGLNGEKMVLSFNLGKFKMKRGDDI